jgi:hypothetical protein
MAVPLVWEVFYGNADPDPTLQTLNLAFTGRDDFNGVGVLRFASLADARLFAGAHPTARPNFPHDETVWNDEPWRKCFTRVAYFLRGRQDPDDQWRRAPAPPTCRNARYWWRIPHLGNPIPLLVFNSEADATAWLAANPNEIVVRQWPQSDVGHAYNHQVPDCYDAYQVLNARARGGGDAADVAGATCVRLNASFEAVVLHTPRAWHGQDEHMTTLVRHLRAAADVWKRLQQGGQAVSCLTCPTLAYGRVTIDFCFRRCPADYPHIPTCARPTCISLPSFSLTECLTTYVPCDVLPSGP